jgi:hypothetical protein
MACTKLLIKAMAKADADISQENVMWWMRQQRLQDIGNGPGFAPQ